MQNAVSESSYKTTISDLKEIIALLTHFKIDHGEWNGAR